MYIINTKIAPKLCPVTKIGMVHSFTAQPHNSVSQSVVVCPNILKKKNGKESRDCFPFPEDKIPPNY